MLALIASCALLVASPAQEDAAPDKKVIAQAVDEIKSGLKAKETSDRVAVLQKHGELAAKEVCVAVAKAVKDKDDAVKTTAIDALRFNRHDEALAQLHSIAKRNKELKKNEEIYPLVLKAIGQHGDVKSIPILTSEVFSHKTPAPVKARILSLGKIRSTKSVEALINMMNTARRAQVQNYMREFRLALMVLTARDEGNSQDTWIRWWNKNKKTFEVTKAEPKLPGREDVQWKSYWGDEYVRTRDKRRKKRGDDPETGGGSGK